MLLWCIWFTRDSAIHDQKICGSSELINWGLGLFEFQNYQLLQTLCTSSSRSHGLTSWSPPPMLNLKLNTDVAAKQCSSCIGVGAAICDCHAKLLLHLLNHC